MMEVLALASATFSMLFGGALFFVMLFSLYRACQGIRWIDLKFSDDKE